MSIASAAKAFIFFIEQRRSKSAKQMATLDRITAATLLVKGATLQVLGISPSRAVTLTRSPDGLHARIQFVAQARASTKASQIRAIQERLDEATASTGTGLHIHTCVMPSQQAQQVLGDIGLDFLGNYASYEEFAYAWIPGVAFLSLGQASAALRLPSSTAAIGPVKITKVRSLTVKGLLEIQFELTDLVPSTSITFAQSRVPTLQDVDQITFNCLPQPQPAGDDDSAASSAEDGDNDRTAKVTPWVVESDAAIDYNRLIEKFGTKLITAEQVARIQRLTGRTPHRFLRRGIFFSHRDLDQMLDMYESGTPFYLYTGRGPSSEAMHVGHLVPFLFTQWLQEAFNVPLVIQLTDDEKFWFKGQNPLEYFTRLGIENSRDIIACGFDPHKTFLFLDTRYMRELWPLVVKISDLVTVNQSNSLFGFDGTSSAGQLFYPSIQAAPSFPQAFPVVLADDKMPCFVPMAIDQDAFFRMTRDVAPRLKLAKPTLIHSKFFPPLQASSGKMSASDTSSAVYLTDKPEDIKRKIATAYSGGQETLELHRRFGATLEEDVPYTWLTFFLESDDELESIGAAYKSGQMTTGEVKAILAKTLQDLVAGHQARRGLVTEDVVEAFMTPRRLARIGDEGDTSVFKLPAVAKDMEPLLHAFDAMKCLQSTTAKHA